MRKLLFVFLLTMLITGQIAAQETTPTWLTEEPLLQTTIYDTSKIVWLDNDTLIFESNTYELVTFQYQVSTKELIELDTMPLRVELTDDVMEHYQISSNETLYRSPFSSSETDTPVIYESKFHIYCGVECAGGLIMLGNYPQNPESPFGNYEPIADIVSQCGISVTWGRSDVAIIGIGSCYGYSDALYHINLIGDHPANRLPLFIDFLASLDQHLLAISDDGSKVLYESYSTDRNISLESVYLWETNLPTESEPLPTVEQIIEIPANNMDQNAFAAANFISDDANHVIAVHTDGIVRINLEDDTREILNSDIKTSNVQFGLFSPDNRHLFAITEYGLYVVETGL